MTNITNISFALKTHISNFFFSKGITANILMVIVDLETNQLENLLRHSEFEYLSFYYASFWRYTQGKSINPYSTAMVKIELLCLYKNSFDIKKLTKVDMPLKKKLSHRKRHSWVLMFDICLSLIDNLHWHLLSVKKGRKFDIKLVLVGDFNAPVWSNSHIFKDFGWTHAASKIYISISPSFTNKWPKN